MADDVSEATWTNWNISVMAIGTAYCLTFLITTIYNYLTNSNKSQNEIRQIIIITVLLHIASWMVHFISSMTTFIKTDNNLDDNHDNANYIICAMIILHPLLFYTLTITRLYLAFNSSMFKMKVIEFLPVILFGGTAIVSRFIEQTSWILVIHGNPPIIDVDKLIKCLWTFISFDIITRLYLVYLFVRKLWLIVMRNTDEPSLQRSTSDIHGHGAEAKKKESVVLNMQQIAFLGVIKKITLLGVCSAVPLAIARAIFVIDFVAVKGFFTHKNWIVFNTLQCLAVFLELLAIVLSFSFNQGLYFIFCKYCDSVCQRCCQREAKRKITMSQQHEGSVSPSSPSVVSTSGNERKFTLEMTKDETDITYNDDDGDEEVP